MLLMILVRSTECFFKILVLLAYVCLLLACEVLRKF